MDYEFYQSEYGGKVELQEFNRLLIQAKAIVSHYTFNRANDDNINVKYTLCELIDYISEEEKIKTEKEIQSESVGSHSVTYAIAKNRVKNSDIRKKEQKEIVYKYLSHTGLLYRGV